MAFFDETTHSYKVYKDKTTFLGVADIALPDINFMTEEIKGAGIGGTTESVLMGMTEAMTLTINWRNTTKEALSLVTPDIHTIDLRQIQQGREDGGAKIKNSVIKHTLKIKTKNFKPGKIEVGAKMDSSGEYAVSYWKITIDGTVELELDPFNFKAVFNGKDYLADVRKGLGM